MTELSIETQQSPQRVASAPPVGPRPLEDFAQVLIKLFAGLGSLAVEWSWSELILRAGWLPHRTLPPDLIVEASDVEDADKRLAGFFRERWPEVEESLRQSVQAAAIDDAATDAFAESLQAHRLGLYRVAPTLLFPHIERVARDALQPGAMGASPTARLSDAVGTLGASEFVMPGVSGLRLYSKLADHLYRQVRAPDEVAAAENNPVPNRHAVLHGRVNYASEKSSLNMLIMADFIFDAISKLKP